MFLELELWMPKQPKQRNPTHTKNTPTHNKETPKNKTQTLNQLNQGGNKIKKKGEETYLLNISNFCPIHEPNGIKICFSILRIFKEEFLCRSCLDKLLYFFFWNLKTVILISFFFLYLFFPLMNKFAFNFMEQKVYLNIFGKI